MQVLLSFLGERYQNIREDKVDNDHQQDNNIVFFMHAETLLQVVRQSHRICATTVHRYATFIKFQAYAHNINLLPTKYPLQQIHQVSFVVIDDDVDAIFNIWLEKWHSPLAEPLPEEKNVEEPPIHQFNAEEHEGDNTQYDSSQEHIEYDDDMDDAD